MRAHNVLCVHTVGVEFDAAHRAAAKFSRRLAAGRRGEGIHTGRRLICKRSYTGCVMLYFARACCSSEAYPAMWAPAMDVFNFVRGVIAAEARGVNRNVQMCLGSLRLGSAWFMLAGCDLI